MTTKVTEAAITVPYLCLLLPKLVFVLKQLTFGSQGLTPSGYLLAATEDGQTCELHPDGNRYFYLKQYKSFVIAASVVSPGSHYCYLKAIK